MSQIHKLLARDVMNNEVVVLRADAPLADAVASLEEYRIGGAPVVDEAGACVGVFTSTDLLKRRVELDQPRTTTGADYFNTDPLAGEEDEPFSVEDYDEGVLGRDTVGQWMTTEVKSVPPAATVEEVCRKMAEERIHRVLVMDRGRLQGIISSFDIVTLVAGLRKGSPVGNLPRHRG